MVRRRLSDRFANGLFGAEGFSLITAADFFEARHRIHDGVGVYALLIEDGHKLVARAGFAGDYRSQAWDVGVHSHLYTGESFGVRSRVECHLAGTIHESNFRKSMLALQLACDSVSDAPMLSNGLEACESWLTDWLEPRTLVAFKRAKCVVDVETDILARAPSPLNIMGRGADPFARRLRAMRKSFDQHPAVVAASAVRPAHRKYRH